MISLMIFEEFVATIMHTGTTSAQGVVTLIALPSDLSLCGAVTTGNRFFNVTQLQTKHITHNQCL